MAAQNSKPSAPGRPFQPGQSGNPGGRPKGIARQLRDAIDDDPSGLAQVLLNVAYNSKARDGDRIAAVREYLDRSYGKAPTFAPVDGDPLDLLSIDRTIGEIVDELANRRETTPPGEAPSGELAATG